MAMIDELQTRNISVAMLLSLKCFEDFYRDALGLSCESYIQSYRNDFSFSYGAALAAEGVEVVIYLPSWECRGLHRLENGVSVRFLPLAGWFRLWQRNPILSRTPIGRYVSEIANTMSFEPSLRKSLIEDQVSTLYIQEYWTGRFDYLASVDYIKVIGSDHGGRRDRQLTLFKSRSFRRALAITSQSQNECDIVKSFGGQPELLQNGIDTTFYSPSGAERTKSILMVARLENEQKRITDVMEALVLLDTPWMLRIAGAGRDDAFLRRTAAQLGLTQRVEFLGFVKDKTHIRDLYRECGVLCMPSAYEAVTLAVLEAMSCECPVVVSDIRSFNLLIEEGVNGFRVPLKEPAAIAKAVALAWEMRAKIGIAGRKRVLEHHSITTVAKRLKSLITRSHLEPAPLA